MNASLGAISIRCSAHVKRDGATTSYVRERYGSWMDFPINPFNVVILNPTKCGIMSIHACSNGDTALQHDLYDNPLIEEQLWVGIEVGVSVNLSVKHFVNTSFDVTLLI